MLKSSLFKQGCVSAQHLFWTFHHVFYELSQSATSSLLPTHTCPKLIQMLLKASWLIHFFGEGCVWALRNAHQKLQIINIPLQWGEDKLHVIGISICPRKGLGEACQLFPEQGMKEAAWTWFQPWSYLRAMVVTGGAVSLYGFYLLSQISSLGTCVVWAGRDHPAQTCCCSRVTESSWDLNIPTAGDSTASLGACSSVWPVSWSERVFLCSDGISCVCFCLIHPHQVLWHINMIIPEPFL